MVVTDLTKVVVIDQTKVGKAVDIAVAVDVVAVSGEWTIMMRKKKRISKPSRACLIN